MQAKPSAEDPELTQSSPATSASCASCRFFPEFQWIPGNLVWAGQLWAVGLLAFGVAAVVGWFCPYAPRVHDEFSQLLAADTLLHGRLANPTPTVWQPLQSFHVIMQPSYASKYPFGSGLLVALGWLIFGTPIASSWLAAGICSASIAWMLAGLVSRRWALAGGLLVAVHPVLQLEWSQSLLHGWLPAIGASLLTGGVLRLRRGDNPFAASLAGLGVSLLALSRPFEGLVCCFGLGIYLWVQWSPRSSAEKLRLAWDALRIAMAPIGCGLALIALHNHATTGRWTQMPYQVHERQYAAAPVFIFQGQQTPQVLPQNESSIMRSFFHGWALNCYLVRQGLAGYVQGIRMCLGTLPRFWSVALWLLPIITLGFWARHRAAHGLALVLAFQIGLSSCVCWVSPHYLSPMLPWLIALAVVGARLSMRAVTNQKARQQIERVAIASILGFQVAVLCVMTVRTAQHPRTGWAFQRAALCRQLDQSGGKHLVLVQYADDHDVHQEWVYNEAEIAEANIIWARHERAEWTQQLLDHYAADRQVWLLRPDPQSVEHNVERNDEQCEQHVDAPIRERSREVAKRIYVQSTPRLIPWHDAGTSPTLSKLHTTSKNKLDSAAEDHATKVD